MNLTNLKLLARAYVPGAKETDVVTDPVLTLLLNQGVVDIATKTACLKKSKTFTVTADDYDYSLSSVLGDYLTMDKPGIWWNAGTVASPNWQKLDPRTMKYFDTNSPSWRDDDSDDPLEYSIEGDVLTLRPTPDTTLANGLWVYYGAMPIAMSAGAHFPFTGTSTEYTHLSIFDDAILAFVEWKLQKALNKGQDPYAAKAKAYLGILETKEVLFKRRLDINAHRDTKFQGRKLRK